MFDKQRYPNQLHATPNTPTRQPEICNRLDSESVTAVIFFACMHAIKRLIPVFTFFT